MASNGLRDAGYQYVNLDDCWCVNRTAEGVLFADPVTFPPSTPGANDGVKLVAREDRQILHAPRAERIIESVVRARESGFRQESDTNFGQSGF